MSTSGKCYGALLGLLTVMLGTTAGAERAIPPWLPHYHLAIELDVDQHTARVFEQECETYPEAIRLIAAGRVQFEGRRVRIDMP